MSTLTLKFHGIQEWIINSMVENGIAETKSEAVRMAVLKFGLDLGMLDSKKVLDSIRENLAKDERSEKEILKGISEARL